MLLLDDFRIVPGASPETAFDQEMVQLNKPGHRHVRRADLHSGASHRIEHPHRYYSHHAGRRLDVGNAARTTLLAVANPDTTPKERVPPIMDLHLLPDMGRMTERWPRLVTAVSEGTETARRALRPVLPGAGCTSFGGNAEGGNADPSRKSPRMERREARVPDRKGTRGASQAPWCAVSRRTNRCLASTGRLSALRPPLVRVGN